MILMKTYHSIFSDNDGVKERIEKDVPMQLFFFEIKPS